MATRVTGDILKHMTHTEDLLCLGADGCNFALESLRGVYNALNGKSDKSYGITAKIDGSPAVVASTDFHGKKFVALKHSWNNGKIYTSEEEIAEAFPDKENVRKELTTLLQNLNYINIPKNEIWMGDFLFTDDTLKTREYEGKEYITFQPNTLVYAIPMEDPLSSQIATSKLGIAWHTRYTGESFDNVSLGFKINISEVNDVPNIYQMDANLKSTGDRILTDEEAKFVEKDLDELKERLGLLCNYLYKEDVKKVIDLLNTYRNFLIKNSNEQFPDVEGFVAWIKEKFWKESLTRKTERGRQNVLDKGEGIVSVIIDNETYFSILLSCQKRIIWLKEFFISKLNSTSRMRTFVDSNTYGLLPTSGEGFVVSDSIGNVQKMVSRLEFSRNNFSSDIIKGWTSDKRNTESF